MKLTQLAVSAAAGSAMYQLEPLDVLVEVLDAVQEGDNQFFQPLTEGRGASRGVGFGSVGDRKLLERVYPSLEPLRRTRSLVRYLDQNRAALSEVQVHRIHLDICALLTGVVGSLPDVEICGVSEFDIW